MKPPEYNLLDEPWIPVQLLDGTITEVGLLELLQRSTDIADLACELPTQNIAIQRLVLAVAYRVATPLDAEAWAAQWDHGAPTEEMAEYLEKWRDRFYLFGGQYPFMQVADLHTANNETKPLHVIIEGVPKEEKRLFSTRHGSAIERITAADAARWLVHVQAYDSSGIRSGAVGDAKLSGGNGKPIGPAWCAQLGIIWLKGQNFDETIVLNLIPSDSANLYGGDNFSSWGACSWEKKDPWTSTREDYSILSAKGKAKPEKLSIPRLLTWQSRRVRLLGDSTGVDRVVLCQGDKLTSDGMNQYEPQSLWYRKPKDVYSARVFSPGRALWRNLPGILSPQINGADKGVSGAVVQSATLSFHHCLNLDEVSTQFPVRMCVQAVGVSFGNKNKTDYEDIYFDELVLSTVLLLEGYPSLVAEIKKQVDRVEKVAQNIGLFASNLALAAGDSSNKAGYGARDRAKERFFSIVDDPFRAWIMKVDGQLSAQEVGHTWERQLHHYAIELKKELIADASSSSFIGRRIGDRFMNVAIAESIFDSKLRQILPKTDNKREGMK